MSSFQEIVWKYYTDHRRDMPWRTPEPNGSYDPYKVMVSEVMLQQTQVVRVIPKYELFIRLFPDVQSLASADLVDVIKAWSGLGYNRRARFLWLAAQAVIQNHDGKMPVLPEQLVHLPGIGPNTAAAIVAYTSDTPAVFVETNIRTVFIHHFFVGQDNVSDKAILDLVRQELPQDDIRNWYYALMDYGSFLKSTTGNISRRAKAYIKQSTFEGSKRQLRGKILRLLALKNLNIEELKTQLSDKRTTALCEELQKEGLIHLCKTRYTLG